MMIERGNGRDQIGDAEQKEGPLCGGRERMMRLR
jgi:hypothetical protein